MFEYPEVQVLSRQLGSILPGKTVDHVGPGTKEHKFLFAKPEFDEQARFLTGRKVEGVEGLSKTVLIRFDDERYLGLCEFGGQLRYHEQGSAPPNTVHWTLCFEDDTKLSLVIQMWGFITTGAKDEVLSGYAAYDPSRDPLHPQFTLQRFVERIDTWPDRDKKAVKALMTCGAAVQGVGNGYLHDILFRAKILPMRKVCEMKQEDLERLFAATVQTMKEACQSSGRNTETDLFGSPGGFRPILDKRMAGRPCPACATAITKRAFLGGSCYYCENCQS